MCIMRAESIYIYMYMMNYCHTLSYGKIFINKKIKNLSCNLCMPMYNIMKKLETRIDIIR